MWSQKPPEAVLEVVKLKIFLGEHASRPPPPPQVWACYARCDSNAISSPLGKNPV